LLGSIISTVFLTCYLRFGFGFDIGKLLFVLGYDLSNCIFGFGLNSGNFLGSMVRSLFFLSYCLLGFGFDFDYPLVMGSLFFSEFGLELSWKKTLKRRPV
jgi:hypothetical protein